LDSIQQSLYILGEIYWGKQLIGGNMWTYSLEVPNLLILGIVLLFYCSRPRLASKRNRAFIWMVFIETVTIIADVFASYLDNNYYSYPPVVVSLANMLYFVAFFIRSYIMYYFAVNVMKDTLERNIVIGNVVRIPLYFGVFISVFSFILNSDKLIYYVDASGYHSGGLYMLLYVCGFYYILMVFISMYLFGKSIKRRREKYGMAVYNLILLVALVMRMIFNKQLILDTFVLMAILIVFLAFENPDFYLDLRGTAFNRLAFNDQLEENLGRFQLMPVGVVVHNFHEMRDVYGSSKIEEGLTLISKYLKQVFPKGKIFYCRNGRFIVLVNPYIDVDERCKVIGKRFEEPWLSEDMELYLSVGFAVFDVVQDAGTPEVILTTMLKFLEYVGNAGSSEPIHATKEHLLQTKKEKEIRQHIEKAVENSSLELFLQPIVDAKNATVIGAEALSRLRDENGEIIMPGDFIHVAENSGRINELGEIIFEKTCKFISEEGLEKLGIDWINVNLSPAQFVRTDLAERYAYIAKKYNVNPELVHLEITESAMIDDSFFNRQIRALTQKGFKFVLDDYGTGYSNLSRLKKCPFINIKLDMTIVWDYCKEPEEILPTMVKAFKQMGFMITAEGVETPEMINAMKGIGCDYLQGYHYSKAIPAHEFAKKYSCR